MKGLGRCIALWCALFVASPLPLGAGEVCFEDADADRLLKEVEGCRVELPLLRDLVTTEREYSDLQVERAEELKRRQEELLNLNEQAAKQMEAARKSAGGSWWEQLVKAGKWIGLGALVGFAVGAAR